jgi:hypothetical protein
MLFCSRNCTGLSYKKFNPEKTVQSLQSQPVKRRTKWYYFLIFFAIPLFFYAYNHYQSSLEPVSFTASDIHFVITNGTIHVLANITNPSQPALMQVNAAIQGSDAGVCNYGFFQTNKSTICNFSSSGEGLPQISCAELGYRENYTLTLDAYFANTKTATNSYLFSHAQLPCA